MRVGLHRHRLVAALEQMPHPPMAPIEPLRIHPVQLAHPARQRRLQRHHEQMEVIAHQAVREHAPAVALGHRLQDLEEPLPIPIIPKHRAPLVPTHDNVKDTASMLDPRRTHHQPSVSPEQTTLQRCGRIVTLLTQDGAEGRPVERRRPDPGSTATKRRPGAR